MQLCKRSDPQT